MKHFFSPLIVLLSFFVMSCNHDDGQAFPVQLDGVWEQRVYVDSVDFWVVNSFEFKANLTYQFRTTVRKTASGEDLGFRYVHDDSYTWDGINFIYFPNIVNWIDTRGKAFYVQKQELLLGTIDYQYAPEASLTFIEKRTKMIYQQKCPRDFVGCLNTSAPIEYVRVNSMILRSKSLFIIMISNSYQADRKQK